jgi:hypothetical protein
MTPLLMENDNSPTGSSSGLLSSATSSPTVNIKFTVTNLKPFTNVLLKIGDIDLTPLTMMVTPPGGDVDDVQREMLKAWLMHVTGAISLQINTVTLSETILTYKDFTTGTIPAEYLTRFTNEWNAITAGTMPPEYTPRYIYGNDMAADENGVLAGEVILPKSVVTSFISNAGTLILNFYDKTATPGVSWAVVPLATLVIPYTGIPGEKIYTPTNKLPSTIGTSLAGGFTPLAQTFKIEGERWSDGICLTSVELFFSAKGDKPVNVEIRPMASTGGVPDSTTVLPESSVTLNAVDIKVPTNPTTGFNPDTDGTVFTMPKGAIWLPPGEYAICISSNSDKYSLFYGKLGEPELGNITNIVKKDPYLGKMFKSQGSSGWTEQQATDLCFRLSKAKFETTSTGKSFVLRNTDVPFQAYNDMYLSTTDFGFPGIADIKFEFTGKTLEGDEVSLGKINENVSKHIDFYTLRANLTGDMRLTVTYFNSDPDLTPGIDVNNTNIVTIKNLVDPYETDTEDSELSYLSGVARSKYISKVVELQDGFDSTGLEVKLDVNRTLGTDISVYCRVISALDIGTDAKIENRNWRLMPLFNQRANTSSYSSLTGAKTFAYTDSTKFYTETYKILEGDSEATTGTPNLSYTANTTSGSATFNSFNKFQVKVVFWASQSSQDSGSQYVPRIKNLIATAVI